MRIAIAEADPAVADLLLFVAQRRGHQPICVPEARRLLDRLPFEPAAVIVSVGDIDDPALATVSQLRANFPDAVLLVLADRNTSRPTLDILKAGAQDVFRGPFHPHEVLFKAEAWAERRMHVATQATGITLADLEVDLDLFAATKNGQQLTLTKLERRLLYCLCQHYPNIAPLERLLAFGWDSSEEPDAGLLKTHVSHIRKKLREAGGVPFEIISQQTVGYAIRYEEQRARAS